MSSDDVLPTPLKLRKEKHRLRETASELTSEQDVLDTVADLNVRIMQWLRAPSGPQIPIGPADADAVVEQWHADQATRRAATSAPATPPADAPEDGAAPTRQPWWRRLFGSGRS